MLTLNEKSVFGVKQDTQLVVTSFTNWFDLKTQL